MKLLKPKPLSFLDETAKEEVDTFVSKTGNRSRKPNRIIYKTLAGNQYVLQMSSKSWYHIAIFQALFSGLQSNWLKELATSSAVSNYELTRYFVEWINNHDLDRVELHRYQCLKDFDSYKRNVAGIKHSGLRNIKVIISHGLKSEYLSKDDLQYLDILLGVSKLSAIPEAESYTLTQWFNVPLLRDILGERKFLQLESPKSLITSFQVVIAVTLSVLLECRTLWRDRICGLRYANTLDEKWYEKRNHLILMHIGRFNVNGSPTDILTRALLLDLVNAKAQRAVEIKIQANDLSHIPIFFEKKDFKCRTWQTPKLFTATYSEGYTSLEERLAAWLAACEGIQPSDIPKLKSTDYAFEFTESGRLLLMQCKYYKGRSGNYKQPPMLMASDCWTKAMYDFIHDLPESGPLFKTKINRSTQLPWTGDNATCNSEIVFLYRLWQTEEYRERLNRELIRTKSSSLFLDAMLGLEQGTDKHSNRKQIIETSEIKYTPKYLFRLGHIKTSSIHARTDKYRDADLINVNSHTSLTEKHDYLTDANKDWVNRCGRITRLVLHDLQNNVYQPSVERIRKEVMDLELRTKVVKATEIDDARIETINFAFINDENSSDIIVTDSTDSALYFIHYIRQAEICFQRLLKVRPNFVERTLLIQVEWMTRVLIKMRSARQAEIEYARLRDFLPPMFDYLMETAE